MTGGAGDQPPPYHSYVQSSPAQIYIEASFKNGLDEMPKLKKAVQFDKNRPKELSTVIEEIFYNDVAWNDIKCLAIAEKKSQKSEEFESVLSKYETTLCEDGAKYQVVFYDATTVSNKWLSKFFVELSPPPLEDPKGSKKTALVEAEKSKQSSAFLRVFKDRKFVVDDVFSFEPSTPHTFQDLIAYLDEKHNLVEKNDAFRIHTYAFILKVAGENIYTEVDLNGVVEDGTYYIVRFLTGSDYAIKGDVSAYLKIHCRSGSKKLQFQLIQTESARKKTMDTSSDRRVEDLAKRNHDLIPKEVTPSRVFLSLFKNGRFVADDVFSFEPNAPHTLKDLVAYVDEKHNLVENNEVCLKILILKGADDNIYTEVDLNGVIEDGMNYHVCVVATQLLMDSGRRVEDLSKRNHEMIPKELTPVKSSAFLKVFKNYQFVADDVFSFNPSTPHTFQDLIAYLDKKHNLVAKTSRFVIPTYVWILKVAGENNYTEVDLNGVVEDGVYYTVRAVNTVFLIKGMSAYLKIRWTGDKKLEIQLLERESAKKKTVDTSSNRRVEDLDKNKREDVAPAQSLVYLRVEKNRRLVVEDAVAFDSSSPLTFQNLIDHINANHNVFAESKLFRQSIYVCIFKVVKDQKNIEADLNGMVEGGVTYHVQFNQSIFDIEDGVSAVFKVSYGGHEYKKHEFELFKMSSAREKKTNNVNGRCEQFSKKEDQAVLSAKPEINIQVYKNGTHLWSAPMPITRSECPSFKSLLSYLNNKLKIFDIIGMSGYAWILKDIGENRHDEVDLDGVVEGATYQVHFSNFRDIVEENFDVTAYFKLTYSVNEKLEFMKVVKEYPRAKKNKENVSGRLVVREELLRSSKHEEISSHRASESSRIQPEKDLIRFERGEIDLLLKTNKAEGLRRELPTILQDVPAPSKITSGSRKAITMVLLGETGVGKSTLINGMVNYIAYSSLSEAESNRPKYLIPARFLYDGKKILIGEQNASENIQFDGESATQRPTVYEFTENEQLYRIIDVPGIGDSRGVEQDRKNFDYILEEINRHEEINAFCILIPPNGSRITVATRYCIYELLSNLHKDAARNIVFCFTKARSTFYEGGDTLPILRDYLANLKSQQDVEIALDEDQNVFYFDNEPFKYLWLKENGINLDHQRKEYDRSFNVSRESTVKLFEYVRNLPPHDTTAMKALTETRRLILNMVPISAAASRKIRMNKSNSSGLVTIEDILELKKELRALAARQGEISDMLKDAEGVTAMPIEPPAAKSPEKPEPEPRKAKKPESRSAEDSSKKSKKKANGGGKTYNKSMLDDFL